MEQAAGDRLTADATSIGGETRRLRFGLAGGTDNADIRRLLRDTPVAGWVSLSYEREPDYFRAAAAEGDVHETLVGRDRRTGELIVMASFSVQDAWVNGERARVGYLGQLRLSARHLSRPWPVLEGYRFIRRMVRRRADVGHVLTSIVSTNTRAKRLLTSGSRNLPVYAPLAGFWTLAYPCRRLRARTADIGLLQGGESDASDISRFLEQQASRFQFAPSWNTERLWDAASCPDLAPGDFLLATRGSRLVGCIALWDQDGFKQHVVRGYAPWIARCRPMLNVGAALSGLPRLPSLGSRLRLVSLSHLAVADDDPGVLEALLHGALGLARTRGYQLAVTGMVQGHPLLERARRFARHVAYQSDIYRVHWDEPGSPADLDKRPLHLEAAIL
jgi:hypothetical protein